MKYLLIIFIAFCLSIPCSAASLYWEYTEPRDNVTFEVWYKIGNDWHWLDRTPDLKMKIPDDQVYPCYFYVVGAWINYPVGTNFQGVPSPPVLYLPEAPKLLSGLRLSNILIGQEPDITPPAIPTGFEAYIQVEEY